MNEVSTWGGWGGGHDCKDTGGRATQDAVAEDARNKKARINAGFLKSNKFF